MKCPKCGNERIEIDMMLKDVTWWKCICGNEFKDLNDYQQRLDKVLSKFDKDKKYHISRYRRIVYDNGFWLDFVTKISLETVESIIKDLEELND